VQPLFAAVNVRNKLECLSLAGLFSFVQCLWTRPGAYPTVEMSGRDKRSSLQCCHINSTGLIM